MHENESTINGLNDDIILPDGWENDDDLFTLPEDTDYNSPPPDETETEPPVPDATVDKPADDKPDDKPGVVVEGDSPDGEKSDGNAEDVPAKVPEATPKYKYTIRVNHQTKEIELTEAELIARLQKSYAADEKASRDRYRAVYNEQIAAGMSEAAARLIAKDAAEGKSYSLDDDGADSTDNRDDNDSSITDGKKAANAETAREAGFRAELQQIKDIYPDFDTVPKAVLDEAANGGNLLAAYVKYRNAQAEKKSTEAVEKETTALKKQNAALAQRIRTAQQAPVKGVSSGGNPSATDQQSDPFMSGFDSAW